MISYEQYVIASFDRKTPISSNYSEKYNLSITLNLHMLSQLVLIFQQIRRYYANKAL